MELNAYSNMFLSVLLNEPERDAIVEKTTGVELVSPEILPYEIVNALSAMYKCRRLTSEQCLEVLDQFHKIPVRLVKVDLKNALNIAPGNKIYAYVAYYLEIAKRLGRAVMSLDRGMKDVAAGMGIRILEVP